MLEEKAKLQADGFAKVTEQEQSPEEQQERFLRTLFGRCSKGYVEIRTMTRDSKVTNQKWYPVGASKIPNLSSSEHVYVGVATREENKGTKSDLVQFPAAWTDIDFKDIDRAEVDRRIEASPVKPSMIVESGYGYHMYYIFGEALQNNEASRVEDINKRLAEYFGGDVRSIEAARILRLPGTNNIKYKDPRPVTMKSINDMTYNINDFDSFPQVQAQGQVIDFPVAKTEDWYTRVLREGVSEGERHASLIKLASHYLNADIREHEVQVILSDWNQKNKPPLSLSELQKTILDIYKRYGKNVDSLPDLKSSIESAIMHDRMFVAKKTTPKPYIIEPLIKLGEIIMISAARGVGKTMLALTLAYTATRQTTVGKWTTDTPVDTLYIDGEMSMEEMQGRMVSLKLFRQPEEKKLYFLSSDYMRANDMKSPNLNDKLWRDSIEQYLKDHPEIRLVILDNIASLTPGRDENKKLDWDNINQWLLNLRSKDIAVIFLHHFGKGGEPRGSSAIEDNINFSIELKRPEGYQPPEGCKFIVEYSKSRRLYGDDVKPFTMQLVTEDSTVELQIVEDVQTNSETQILEMWRQGMKQKDIAKAVGKSESWVSQTINNFKKQLERRMKAVAGTDDNPGHNAKTPDGEVNKDNIGVQSQNTEDTGSNKTDLGTGDIQVVD